MSSIKAEIYNTECHKTYTGIDLYFYPEDLYYSIETVTQRLQQLMEALTTAHTYRPFLGQPINPCEAVGMPTEPIDSELGSTFAALLAFSAARGKGEHPATLIKALVYGLVRYHHTAYLQDKTAPAGDFTTPMHVILETAENYNIRIYDEDDEAAAPDSDHGQYATNMTPKLITVEEAYKMLQDGNLPDEYELTYKCPENIVHEITDEGELDYRVFYSRNVDDDPVYGGYPYDDDENADSLCITLAVPATPVECPQCEKVFTDPADTNAIGDHALCTTCLAAWRPSRAMLNYAPGGWAGDGYSEEPPFLPIPEWWAARGLATPDILADIAYDKNFKEMEIRQLDTDELEPQPTLLVNVFSGDIHEFTMIVSYGKAHRKTADCDMAKAFEANWESALEHLRITDPVEWNVSDVIKIMRDEFNWLIDSEKYPVTEVAY